MKRIIKVLIYPLIFIFGQFAINYIFVCLFNKHQLRLLSNKYPLLSHKQLMIKLNHLMTTSQYKNSLNNYINSKSIIIVLSISIIFIPIFINKYKQYPKHKRKKITRNDIIFIVLLGISISTIFNLTFSSLNYYFHFTKVYHLSELPIYVQIISSGILGPIMEELLFRGIVYNELKKTYKPMKSIVIASFVFALFHLSNPLNVIYSFSLSFMFIYLYEKYKTLLTPMLMHITANITVILMMFLIVQNIIWLNIILIILMITILLSIHKLMIKKDLK